jgi:hypothetical protein
MNYSSSGLLLQATPAQSSALKTIFLIVPLLMIFAGIYLWSMGEIEGSVTLLAEALIVALILRLLLPRSYQVYRDRIRIAFGGPLALNFAFRQIKSIQITGNVGITMNFVTAIRKQCVLITRSRGMNIAITPEHSEMFVASANQALSEWKRNHGIR